MFVSPAVSEFAEVVDFSDLPSTFPRGVGCLSDEVGNLSVDSFDDICGWERNLPLLGALEDMIAYTTAFIMGMSSWLAFVMRSMGKYQIMRVYVWIISLPMGNPNKAIIT